MTKQPDIPSYTIEGRGPLPEGWWACDELDDDGEPCPFIGPASQMHEVIVTGPEEKEGPFYICEEHYQDYVAEGYADEDGVVRVYSMTAN